MELFCFVLWLDQGNGIMFGFFVVVFGIRFWLLGLGVSICNMACWCVFWYRFCGNVLYIKYISNTCVQKCYLKLLLCSKVLKHLLPVVLVFWCRKSLVSITIPWWILLKSGRSMVDKKWSTIPRWLINISMHIILCFVCVLIWLPITFCT